MTVYRTRLLPHGSVRGCYRIFGKLIEDTKRALQVFDNAGGHEGGHEGICYWAGREGSDSTTLETVITPNAYHGQFGVFVSEGAFADVARHARAINLGILAQVHSHPGDDTRHSNGDDNLVIMPFEGMLSLVAPHYGRTINSIMDFSVHQFQNHRWVLCDPKSILTSFQTV